MSYGIVRALSLVHVMIVSRRYLSVSLLSVLLIAMTLKDHHCFHFYEPPHALVEYSVNSKKQHSTPSSGTTLKKKHQFVRLMVVRPRSTRRCSGSTLGKQMFLTQFGC